MKRLSDEELLESISIAKRLDLEDFLAVLLRELKRRDLDIDVLEQDGVSKLRG
ncbi:hypothetical protein Back11_50750 [Paenibacillus baekrokdamisoli]|uniref:Uncharacterized protein n=1 Tax=Paenibacillus baekrokdamisoli TaxID=1712516 RepID=A0A3G9IXX9_9BACL|nr:sporulation histidine kinase inhibitor Sda [Paenibacillus baekrokdamisoli]MBB3068905.1 hypothetical protein [Paenibacillus baekrokdamisoli]BBH23730.1 hypothetical protein Back11_50750 [Paenibacillus baekrokdamisoli]